jgi:membrane-associated protein
MTNTLSYLLSFLLLYKYGALFVLFFVAGLALPIPTSSVLLATGAFASQGYFNFFISAGIIVASNMLGDYVGYFIAKKYGRRAFELMHIKVPAWVEKLEGFLHRYPGSAIFLTRFVGTTDVLANLLCGFGGVSTQKFLWYDFLGNAVADGGILYIGYFLGVHWQDFTGVFGITDYILIAVVVIIVISIIMWSKKRGRAARKLAGEAK